jgi:hypothetical protein
MVKQKIPRRRSLDTVLPLLKKPRRQPCHPASPSRHVMITRGGEKAAKERAKQERKTRQAARKEQVPQRRSRRISNVAAKAALAATTSARGAASTSSSPAEQETSRLPETSGTPETFLKADTPQPNVMQASVSGRPDDADIANDDAVGPSMDVDPDEAEVAKTPSPTTPPAHALLNTTCQQSLPSQRNFLTPQHSLDSDYLSSIQRAPRQERLDPSQRDESFFAPPLSMMGPRALYPIAEDSSSQPAVHSTSNNLGTSAPLYSSLRSPYSSPPAPESPRRTKRLQREVTWLPGDFQQGRASKPYPFQNLGSPPALRRNSP